VFCFVVVVLLTNKLGWGLVVVVCGVARGELLLCNSNLFHSPRQKKKCPCSLYTIRFLGFEKFMLKKYTLFATGKLLVVHP
jgi:hypothetical protein